MSEQQLWFWVEPKPLRERLGDDFFKQAPVSPGVYIMTDRHGCVLYVGQSRNLRQRLNTYKNLRPGKDARKLARLAQAVATITWEGCDTPEAARLRENELLRLCRPKFNTVNTRPEAYGFIGMRASEQQLELWLTQEATWPGELYGAFKGLRWTAYAALLRLLLWARTRQPSPEQFPPRLLGPKPPRHFQFPLSPEPQGSELAQWVELVRAYLDGQSSGLVDLLRQCLPAPETLAPFWQNLQAADLQTLQEFYERGPQRNRQLKARHGLHSPLITPGQLDDLLVLTPAGNESGC